MANKGLSYGKLIVDNIIGLDNEYESFGEKLGKTINKDEVGFLKDSAVGIYEGAKEFITSPIDTTKEVVTNIKDSVQRLGTQDLNKRLKNMYGIGYESATDDQVSAAREAVFGDALTALELIPAAKATVVAVKTGSAAIPSGVKADVVGQTKALFSGDKEFLQGTPSARSATQSLSAGFTGSTPPTYLKRDNPFIEDKGEELSWDQVPFEIADDQLNLLNTKLLMFREPIVEFAETVAIPKKGLLGSQFLAQIKKNESIPETSLQEGIIEPSKRYTKEELLKALGKGTNTQGTFRSVANIADDRLRQFETYQRQKSVAFNGGTEQLYFDIPLDSTVGYPGKKFKANDQHYNPETLVHVRGSIINPSSYGFQRSETLFDILIEDEDYLLVEELQSDLLTKGYIKPKNKFDFLFSSAVENFNAVSSVSYSESFGTFDKQVRDIVKELDSEGAKYPEPPTYEVLEIIKSKEKDFAKIVEQQDINQAAYEDKIDVYLEKLNKKLLDKKIFNEMDAGELNIIYNGYLESKNSQFFTENIFKSDIGLPPIRKNKQAVDEALKVLIAKAAQSGVTKIVIPPADRIVAARGRELSTKEGDRFNRTYVSDLNKSLKDLEDNYPVKIERLVELPYDDAGSDVDGLNLSKEGTVIDISELIANYKVEQPRQFAQGGVAMKDQMEMNFALGGRAETVDPVSGNDVPPGSLPVEVRDDIPARLSEGEYVVPADVVRYFGVRVFEEMRMEAKMGLQQMDADGRIGGEPIAAEPSDMISDEELAQLDDMLSQKGMAAGGLAQGGMVDRLVNMARTNPVVNERIKAAGIPVEMALGGSVGVGIPSNSQNVDPRKVDEVIAKIGVAAQQNPELMRMLGERGINVPRTTAMQTPQQMQQANSPAATTNPLMSGKTIAANAGGLMGYQEGGSADYISQNPIPNFNPERYRTVGTTYFEPENYGPNLGTAPVAPAGPAPVEPAGGCGKGLMWDGQMCVVDPNYRYEDDGGDSGGGGGTTDTSSWFEGDPDVFTNPEDYIEKQLARGGYKKEAMLATALVPGLGLASGVANKVDDLVGIAKARASFEIGMANGTIDPKSSYAKSMQKELDSLGYEMIAGGNMNLNSYAKELGFDSWESSQLDKNKEKYLAADKNYREGVTETVTISSSGTAPAPTNGGITAIKTDNGNDNNDGGGGFVDRSDEIQKTQGVTRADRGVSQTESDYNQTGGQRRDGSTGTEGLGFLNKGGLMAKNKEKPRNYKKGGLASRKK